jgi:hypothetical protein
MLYINNRNKLFKPVPAVIWSIHPKSQIVCIRPSWDPYTKLILPKELDSYYKYGHLLSLAKLLKDSHFYPWDAKFMQIARRNLAFFSSGNFIHLGQNLLIDPWHFDGDKPAEINYYNPFHEYNELPQFYGNK